MAVQKSRKSKSKSKSRRSSYKLVFNEISFEKETNEMHLRHHVTKKGYYRGIQVIKNNKKLLNKDKK